MMRDIKDALKFLAGATWASMWWMTFVFWPMDWVFFPGAVAGVSTLLIIVRVVYSVIDHWDDD